MGGGYYGWKKWFSPEEAVRYITAKVERGVLSTTINGTGQIFVLNQLDVKAKASGDLIYVGIKNGQEVKAGFLLAQLDSREAQKNVRDAEDNLETARLSMEKLKQPADTLTILQAENSLIQAQENKQKAEDDLKKAYEDGFNNVSNAFLELPDIIAGLQTLFYGYTYDSGTSNLDYYTKKAEQYDIDALQYKVEAESDLHAARDAYEINFDNYKAASRFSETSVIEALIDESYETAKKTAEAVKSINNVIQFYKDKLIENSATPHPTANTHLSTLNGYTGKTNSQLLALLSAQRAIQTDKENIISSDRTIVERTESLAKIKADPDPLDIRSQELSIKQRENALLDAKEKLVDYFIRAPFDGVIASTNIKKGDQISSGAAIATLITKQDIAIITLNEIDAAKVKFGQKVMLTFDAIEDLTLTGQVAEVDALGTVSQGVVSYNVKIFFDVQDDRVKPGMSISAGIILNSKLNLLMVPNSAIKTQGGASFVQVLIDGVPSSKQITLGATNDIMTEIVAGLEEGEEIITQKITVGANTAAQPAVNQSTNRGGATGGDMFRMMR